RSGRWPGGHMPVHSSACWPRVAALAIAALVSMPAASAAQTKTRQVSVESLIYDLKNPEAFRREEAVRALGLARYQPATPDLVAMVHDSDETVGRSVELSLERMEDIRSLPGFVALASDEANDIRGRAVAALVGLHLPRAGGLSTALAKLGELMQVNPDR